MTQLQQPKLKILDLFSGLGGFSLGLERTGQFKTVAFCEIDKFCTLLLQKHWKGVKIYNDVKEITKERLEADGIPSPDVITGGFPCQPFSVAGKQAGTSDDRHLWPEMFRTIQEFTPRWIVGENVKGITNIQDGMVFETVCTDLEGEGYEVRTFNIPAAGVGAPHRRERIWIIANRKESMVNPDDVRLEQYSTTKEKASWWRTSTTFEPTGSMENARRTLRPGTELREKNEDETGKEDANQHQRSGSPSESDVADTNLNREKWNQSEDRNGSRVEQDNWWLVEPNVGRVAHGVSGRVHRLKALGNSIVPQIAQEIGRAIIKAEREEWKTTELK